ncbi:hypothetical protein BSKO_00594 [Bryopsis sp. KO-2023]|nr:hypothetical protein BSKO_00594 [Bryopsis sp. KO-2023]
MTGGTLLNALGGRGDGYVSLNVTHSNLAAQFPEIKFGLKSTVGQLKAQLSMRCGTAESSMKLVLKDHSEATVAELSDDSMPLAMYSPHDGFIIHIVDLDPTSASAGGWLEDLSKVEKYVMADEDYASRDNTFRQFRKNLEASGTIPSRQPSSASHSIDHVTVGERCLVEPGEKRGEVRYVGEVEGLASGAWVGVAYDEPLGKNDGTCKGIPYFQCEQGYGSFVRPGKVSCGDYPPVDPFDDDFDSPDEI